MSEPDPGLGHMTKDEILQLMRMCWDSTDPTDIEFAKRCAKEIGRRKPEEK